MTYLMAPGFAGSFDLRATLATSSAQSYPPIGQHHPISCRDELRLEADGTLTCPHAEAGPGDQRTQACLDHSIAILLIELLRQKEDV